MDNNPDEVKHDLNDDSNPYDVQKACFSVGTNYSKFLIGDELDRIKDVAYEQGYILPDFDIVFGILIRDRYFEENDIQKDDVDKHDPGKKEDSL